MHMIVPSAFLRRILMVNALSCAGLGVLLFGLGGLLEPLLGIPAWLSQPLGLSLVCFAGMVGLVEVQERVPPALVWAIIAVNAVWAVDCVVALAAGWITPTPLGVAFVLAQAVWVAVAAEVLALGLTRTPAQPA
ncbi:hypothetical protein [Chelatococcus reniformis]|uniref:Uncharacterized protein n=1 Tax=Chelatococcus reniformis TaxID=1494448 RepID=A0A916TYD1_9HYPH|nr:hypothetical protein [Chelatococcus reniformis]GGC50348.1 hypothetical protein GCM10010994_06860 [Chelatococcus reniformis]